MDRTLPHIIILFVVSVHVLWVRVGRVVVPLVTLAAVHTTLLKAMLAASRARSPIVAFISVIWGIAIMVSLHRAIALLCTLLLAMLLVAC